MVGSSTYYTKRKKKSRKSSKSYRQEKHICGKQLKSEETTGKTSRNKNNNEEREACSAEPLFLVFQGKKSSSYRIAYEGRVFRITFSVCVYVCIKFFGHVCPPHSSVHGTKASSDGSCARTNDRQLFSRWFRCKSLRVRRDRCGNV